MKRIPALAVAMTMGMRVQAVQRDPFVPIQRAAPASENTASRAGLAGLSLDDVRVRGVVQAGGVSSAIVESSAGRSFIAHPNDRLLNAIVFRIEMDRVTFVLLDKSGGTTLASKVLHQPRQGQ